MFSVDFKCVFKCVLSEVEVVIKLWFLKVIVGIILEVM